MQISTYASTVNGNARLLARSSGSAISTGATSIHQVRRSRGAMPDAISAASQITVTTASACPGEVRVADGAFTASLVLAGTDDLEFLRIGADEIGGGAFQRVGQAVALL